MLSFVDWLQEVDHRQPEDDTQRIPTVLALGELAVVYQPIIDLCTQQTFAHEALVRSTSPHYQGPPALFTEAIRTQLCGALGRAVRELAVDNAPDTPLFVNVHPNEFDEGWLVRPDDPIFRHEHRVYLEITESVPLTHVTLCHSQLAEVRSRGAALAVDDLGAGYSNLKYISDLAPEVVKLDRELIVNLTKDSRQHTLVRSLVRLCEDLGATVIAEGIESESEARAVIDTGAHYGQGFLFAKPSYPPPAVNVECFRAVG